MANLKIQGIVIIISMIVGIVLLFGIIGGTASSLTSASNNLYYSDADNCSLGIDSTSAVLTYNKTCECCQNSSGGTPQPASYPYRLPLTSMFTPSGIIMLILMGAIFIGIAIWVTKGFTQK